MRTQKAKRFDLQIEKEIEKAVSKFPHHLMSNSKWVKLIENLVENISEIRKIEFKTIQSEKIGEIYLDEDSSFGFDYWENGFEGMNSLKGWLLFKEIEFLKFSKISNKGEQNITKIISIIGKIGKFDFIENEDELILICYK